MKKALFAALILASSFSHAQDQKIIKSVAPDIVNIRLTGTGLAQFGVRTSDLPRGFFGTSMTVEKLDWRTTYYAGEGFTEEVEICYHPSGSSANKEKVCRDIIPNATDTESAFTGLPFTYESRVIIRHKLSGKSQTVRPVGQDSITLHYRR